MERETFWLIERNVGRRAVWFSNDSCYGWSPSVESAVRYETEADALDAMRQFADPTGWFVTEHSMIGD